MKHRKKRSVFRQRKKWYVTQKQWDRFIEEFHKYLERKTQLHEQLLINIHQAIKKNESFIRLKLPAEINRLRNEYEDNEINSSHV